MNVHMVMKMAEVEFFYADNFETLEILAYTELMKSKQKHTKKLLAGLFSINQKAIVLPNRLHEGDQFKEQKIFEQAQKAETKVYRRLTYGKVWELEQGYFLGFVFPNSLDWKELVGQLFSEIAENKIRLWNNELQIEGENIGFYGTYSDPVNTTVESYLFKTEKLELEELKEIIIDFFEEKYETSSSSKLSIYDENLLISLINGKYNTDSWIIESKPPFIEGKCLIELLVAFPPTRYCKAFIANTKQAVNELKVEDKIELVIYERGKKGQMLRHMISKGILTAFKSHRLPALVINGNLKAFKEVPPVEKIKEDLVEELRKLNLM